MAYTIQDLEAAREELKLWVDRWSNDDSNNPNKYRSQRQQARTRVELIELDLKAQGVIPKTEKEELNEELDRLYPNAKSKSIVTYKCKQYQIRYFPLDESRSGKTVFEWGHRWILLEQPTKQSPS